MSLANGFFTLGQTWTENELWDSLYETWIYARHVEGSCKRQTGLCIYIQGKCTQWRECIPVNPTTKKLIIFTGLYSDTNEKNNYINCRFEEKPRCSTQIWKRYIVDKGLFNLFNVMTLMTLNWYTAKFDLEVIILRGWHDGVILQYIAE